MLRLRCVNSHFRRLLHWAPVTSDHVMEQLKVCKAEDEVFDVVSKNKAKLTVDHINQAMKHLWNFETPKPQPVRNLELTKKHPQFLTLRVLAENKIYYMDSAMLVDMLYRFLRFNVEPHDSLVQQMVSEVWLRLDRLPLSTLSKFAVCLSDQNLHHSPLMGRITHIVDQKLSTIDDARILTTLMIYLSALMSPRLHHAFITRADLLLDTMDQSCYNNARRVLQFMRNTKYNDRPLLEKCNKIILSNITKLYVEDISIIVGLYQSLQFSNYAFRLAAKQRLIELIDSCPDPFSFPLLFYALGPMASDKIRERLENTAFLLADEFNAQQALAIAETLVEAQSRNLSLVNKIASVIQRNLHIYRPLELVKITQAFTTLKYQNPDFLTKITAAAVNFLQRSVLPHEAVILTRILSMLPCPRLEEGIISRVEALVPQCTLNDLNQIAQHVAKWVHNEPSYIYNTPGKFVHLLQTMNRCGHERLQTADRLDLLVEELKYVSGEWYEETQMEETMVTLKRMMDQMNWKVLPELTQFLFRMSHLNPPLMDQIANVAIKDIDKIQPSVMYAILLPFSVLNYDSEQTDELFDKCIQRITSTHLRSLDPQMLVSLAHIFAVGNSFPEELIREIFSIDFLGKLDTHLEMLSNALNMRIRWRLMDLNRAVCLECPEFQVPWFHERFCQQLRKRGSDTPAQRQIHRMLGEVLGGVNCVRGAVVTPYYYTIDFECILDKNLQPVPYSKPSTLQLSDEGKFYWEPNSPESHRDELPPGAQRVALDFLDSRSFCKNRHHMRGEALMKKRHLEILGYQVVQIPHFEWNSMELSTKDAWKGYLKKKIFRELS